MQPDDETKQKMLDILKRFHSEEETDSMDVDGMLLYFCLLWGVLALINCWREYNMKLILKFIYRLGSSHVKGKKKKYHQQMKLRFCRHCYTNRVSMKEIG